jgi:hypothetical protein
MPQAKRKTKGKAIQPRKTRHIAPQRRQPTPKQALMRIPHPPAQSWNLTLDEVALVKNHIAKGASDTELQFCLAVARRHRLDPFRGQIWFVKRRDQSAEGGYRWIPIVGINGLLHVAARDHAKDFGSNDDAEFGPMHTVKWQYNGQGAVKSLQAPEWARIKIWKKGHEHPVVSTVYWDEIYPNIDYAPLVRQMPRGQLEKCALAKGTRRAYPATDGLYIKEEFQGPPEFTPGGRMMSVADPAPDANAHLDKFKEREQEQLAKLNAPQRQYVEDKKAAAKAKEPLMDVEYLDPAKSECGECHSSFGVHLMKCSKFRDPHAAKPIDALFYTLTPSGTYTIDGPQPLKTANKDLLTPLWNGAEKAIIATPQQLGKLISQLEKRHVPFKELQTAREPGSE